MCPLDTFDCMISLIVDFLMDYKYLIIHSSTITLLIYLFSYPLSKIFHSNIKNLDIHDILLAAILKNDVIIMYKIVQKYPDIVNKSHQSDGYTPFMRACLHGKTQLVRIMLNFGADIKLKSPNGETPFYLAAFHHVKNPHVKDASCIHALYYAGSDINDSNCKGYNPLQLAAMFGHTELVIWLLNKGACSLIYPDPYTLARMQGHSETAKIIKRRRLLAIE